MMPARKDRSGKNGAGTSCCSSQRKAPNAMTEAADGRQMDALRAPKSVPDPPTTGSAQAAAGGKLAGTSTEPPAQLSELSRAEMVCVGFGRFAVSEKEA